MGSISIAQSCDTLYKSLAYLPKELPRDINCIDEAGQKQKWWVIYKLKDYEYEVSPNQFEKRTYIAGNYSFGLFENNRKIGVWKYIFNGGDYTYEIKEEVFHKDGSVKRVDNDGRIVTNFSADSSSINSTIILAQDTLCIDCNKKARITDPYCKMTIKNSVLKTFPKEDFEKELASLNYGYYTREILRSKNNYR